MAIGLAGQMGCCCTPWGGCWPCGKNWCGPQCGEKYCCEWFDDPPACCDPCDECGCFIGPRLNDGLYSHGNDYIGYGKRYPEQVQGEPVGRSSPAPAAAPAAPAEPEPYTLPGPSDDMPVDSSSGVTYDEFGQRVSYDSRPARRRGPVYDEPPPRDARAYYRQPVDSRQASRKLAKPPRTRLFSR
jgi:hypothetical protein